MALLTGSNESKPAEPSVDEILDCDLDVTPYDRSAGLLISLLILVGGLVLGLVAAYLTSRIYSPMDDAPMAPIARVGISQPDQDFENTIEPTGSEEMPETRDLETAQILDVLSEASARLVSLDQGEFLDGSASPQGDGVGDKRSAGPVGEVFERVAREQRWRVQYTNTQGIDAYARQLDFFGIELGAYDPKDRSVRYATDLAQANPTTREALAKDDKRLYMFYQDGPLQKFDSQLLQKAKIETNRKRLVQFYPTSAEAMLATLERRAMVEAGFEFDVNQINCTTFGVHQRGTEYTYYVISQVRQ